MSFVVVFPIEPVMPTTVQARRRRAGVREREEELLGVLGGEHGGLVLAGEARRASGRARA